jgi:hypothetical protein
MHNGSKETPAQRRARYLRLSDEARKKAAKIKDRETREAHLALADVWLALADQLDLD